MKKVGLFCVTVLAGLSLAGCNNLASQSYKATGSSSSTKVVKHHKNHKKANRASHKEKQSLSSSSQATNNSNNATSQQGSNGGQQATAQSNNGGNDGQQQAQPQSESTSQGNGEQVYTAHPSQGGTIYQTNGNAGSFQGDPDAIAETQIKMEQAAQRIQNGQQ